MHAVAMDPGIRRDDIHCAWICPKFADDFVVKSADNGRPGGLPGTSRSNHREDSS
jgi:hypothetical protein